MCIRDRLQSLQHSSFHGKNKIRKGRKTIGSAGALAYLTNDEDENMIMVWAYALKFA